MFTYTVMLKRDEAKSFKGATFINAFSIDVSYRLQSSDGNYF